MNREMVVRAEQIGKKFKLYRHPWERAREWLTGSERHHRDFWALREISFELGRGEALGILGQNGAGKSTLLKILTGVLFPTEGRFQIHGKVLSILELGTGFNPELTGRQNVYNSAHLLGFPHDYTAARIDEIEAFAEIGEFFDRPIKIYSSGMRARLAFAMFAFLDCDVLIVDEVLSVGDIFFTQKCYARLDELRASGTAMILVTHNMSVIQQYCQRALVLDKGRVVFAGTSSEATKHYFFINNRPTDPTARGARPLPRPRPLTGSIVQRLTVEPGNREWAPGTINWPAPEAFLHIGGAPSIGEEWARCTAIALCDDAGNPCQSFGPGQRAHWFYEFEALQDMIAPSGSVAITNDKNIRIHGKNSMQLGVKPQRLIAKGQRMRFHQTITLNIAPGEYSFSIALAAMRPEDATASAAEYRRFIASDMDRAGSFHVMWALIPYFGLCDLPGECEMEIMPLTESLILTSDETSTLPETRS